MTSVASWDGPRYGPAHVGVGAHGVTVITLSPTRSLRRAIGHRPLRVTVSVTFTPAGSGAPVRRTLSVTV